MKPAVIICLMAAFLFYCARIEKPALKPTAVMRAYYIKKIKKEGFKYQHPKSILLKAIENSLHFIAVGDLERYFNE